LAYQKRLDFLFAFRKHNAMNDEAEKQGIALQKAISGRIRERRLEKNWSLDKMAEITGLSKGYLSQIENCDKNPPINTLTKIAYALNVDISALITGNDPFPEVAKIAIVRADERRTIRNIYGAEGTVYESVTFKKHDRMMDAFVLTNSKKLPENPLIHEGQELIYVLEGELEVFYEGKSYILNTGDCVIFDSDRPHMGRSCGEKPAKILAVFCNFLRR